MICRLKVESIVEGGKCSGRACSAVAGQASRLSIVSGDYEE